MSLPVFYAALLSPSPGLLTLDETNSKHIVQVLRMKPGDRLQITNGTGIMANGIVSNAHKKYCEVIIESLEELTRTGQRKVGIGISPVKNNSRFEWFLEKATELGVSDIFPLLCKRTIRQHFRIERMQGICISAMLQSQQAWLPQLHEPVNFGELVTGLNIPAGKIHYHQKWIAHCDEFEKHPLSKVLQPGMKDSLILIGPEGDFDAEEIMLAMSNGFAAVALGNTRLRTETAAIAAASFLMLS